MASKKSPSVLTCAQIREVDRIAIQEVGIPGLVLMENAGRSVSQWVASRRPNRVLICCGPGNNGGDGFVIGRHLDAQDIAVDIWLTCPQDRLRGDAAANFQWLTHTRCRVVTQPEIPSTPPVYDVVVDALLGTGFQGEPREPIRSVLHAVNTWPTHRLAVDIPSGLNGDTGQSSECTFRAHTTITFVAAKPGLMTDTAQEFVGDLVVVEIGVPSRLLERFTGK